jgi:hypothetical protein
MAEIEIDVNTNENFNLLKCKTFEKVTIHEKLTPEQCQACIDAGILSPEWEVRLMPMKKEYDEKF